MPYPHVTQFETLDRRRRHTLDTAEVPTRAAVRAAGPRRGFARLWRVRRTPRCAAGAV
jgi:hypothetical protein